MPTLTHVHPWPASARADRPAVDDEVADVAIRACRSVAELYAAALRGFALTGPSSELRVFLTHRSQLDHVEGTAYLDHPVSGFEMLLGHVPTAFADLAPRTRAVVMLDLVHQLVSRLGVRRGWDAAALEACRQYVVDHDYVYRWQSPPKASPDRRLEARADFRLAEDGYGRVRLHLTDRSTEAPVASSEEAVAFCTRHGFERAAKSLRWEGRDQVRLVPYDYVPSTRGGELSLVRGDDMWHSVVDDYLAVRQLPAGDPALPPMPDNVEGRGATAPEQPSMLGFVGGGPLERGRVEAFHDAFTVAIRRLTSPAGQAWWARAPIRLCDVQITYGDGETRQVTARRTGGLLRVHVRVPRSTIPADSPAADADGVAREVAALVARRGGLEPHPAFARP